MNQPLNDGKRECWVCHKRQATQLMHVAVGGLNNKRQYLCSTCWERKFSKQAAQ